MSRGIKSVNQKTIKRQLRYCKAFMEFTVPTGTIISTIFVLL